MKYTIIKNSESNTGFNIPDDVFTGLRDGLLCGWSFEMVKEDGKRFWATVVYYHGLPEQVASNEEWFWEDMGWRPTGTVIFRGYYREYWWEEERDWCVEKVA